MSIRIMTVCFLLRLSCHTHGEINFKPSATPELYCTKDVCGGLSCIYKRTLTDETSTNELRTEQTFHCGNTTVRVSFSQRYSRYYHHSGNSQPSYRMSCWNYSSTSSSFDLMELYVTNVVSFEPTKASELVCFTDSVCPEAPCLYNSSALSTREDVKYSAGVKVLASCKSVKVSIACPHFDGKRVFCTDIRKCYTYESANMSFDVLEVIVKKPKEAALNMSKIHCESKTNNCTVFEETSYLTGYAVGIPRFCFPWEKPDPVSGLYLPSKYSDLFCSSDISHFYGPERYKAELVSSLDSAYSSGAEVLIDCGEIQVEIKCPKPNSTNPICTEIRKCYKYKSDYRSFDVLEILVKKPKEANTAEVDCKMGGSKCPILKENHNEVIFVVGFPVSCYPEKKHL